MIGPHSHEELGWRFSTWRTQYRKEVIRMHRTYGNEPQNIDIPRNIAEDEFDADWHFPLPQPEVKAQLDDLAERILDSELRPWDALDHMDRIYEDHLQPIEDFWHQASPGSNSNHIHPFLMRNAS
ncbi:hypothetical protein MMC07_001524 [Pseudocyphellaria aurata]|nr:hypothetical protein [Pseudocyphellaria aurata]